MTDQQTKHIKEQFFDECTARDYENGGFKLENIYANDPDKMFRWIKDNCLQQTKQIAIDFKKWCTDEGWKYDFTAEKNHTDEELYEIFINQHNQ